LLDLAVRDGKHVDIKTAELRMLLHESTNTEHTVLLTTLHDCTWLLLLLLLVMLFSTVFTTFEAQSVA
jgi:hypothetical protein